MFASAGTGAYHVLKPPSASSFRWYSRSIKDCPTTLFAEARISEKRTLSLLPKTTCRASLSSLHHRSAAKIAARSSSSVPLGWAPKELQVRASNASPNHAHTSVFSFTSTPPRPPFEVDCSKQAPVYNNHCLHSKAVTSLGFASCSRKAIAFRE